MGCLDDLLDALAAFDIETGFPERRSELARSLFAADITGADVERLGGHCRRTVRGGGSSSANVLFSLLRDPQKAKARLHELGTAQNARAKRPAAKEPDEPRPVQLPKPGYLIERIPSATDAEHERWQRWRWRDVAAALARSGWTADAIAHEIGIAVDLARELLAESGRLDRRDAEERRRKRLRCGTFIQEAR